MQGISEEEFAKRPLVTRVEPADERSMEKQYTASTDVGDVSIMCLLPSMREPQVYLEPAFIPGSLQLR